MIRPMLGVALGLGIGLGSVAVAWGDSVVAVSTRSALAGDDLVDWGAATPASQTSFSSISISSVGGLGVMATQSSGSIHRINQGTGAGMWGGNFASGDHLLATFGGGPLTIVFASGISAAGAQVQGDSLGTFSGVLHAFDATGADIGDVNFNGLSTPDNDNSAVFIGIRDLSGANIKSIRFDTTTGGSPEDFAINQVSLDVPGAAAAVPLPSSALAGGGLLALVGMLTRKTRIPIRTV